MDDFEACIAHLRFPVTHRRAIRTTNLLERWSGGASRTFPMPSVNARSRK
jgi:transposase-like protein